LASEPEQRFEPLSAEDEARLAKQRAVVEAHLADDEENRRRYTTPAGKLGLLRALLEAKVFKPTQTWELQCMGIVLGDVFVQKCGWLWRMVVDEYGRDPCVKVPGSSVILFPLTMISKRIERGEEVDVFELYNLASGDAALSAKTAAQQPD
jgi:hypothetical protein